MLPPTCLMLALGFKSLVWRPSGFRALSGLLGCRRTAGTCCWWSAAATSSGLSTGGNVSLACSVNAMHASWGAGQLVGLVGDFSSGWIFRFDCRAQMGMVVG